MVGHRNGYNWSMHQHLNNSDKIRLMTIAKINEAKATAMLKHIPVPNRGGCSQGDEEPTMNEIIGILHVQGSSWTLRPAD
jgi:hypothetical protein